MTSKKALWAKAVCDPELPGRIRLLAAKPFSARTRIAGRPRRWLEQRELARYAERMIFPDALHQDDRRLLARAQNAIDAILGSGVRAAGLLEADEPVLRRHEWEIACAARQLTEVRALSAGTAGAGAMTAAVLDAQQRALAVAAEAAAGRVSALERYAAQVEAADTARRDWQSALQLAGLNDRYLDLVARTAADELAVIEIGELTEQAAVTGQALRHSLRDAGLAAEVLALPPRQAG